MHRFVAPPSACHGDQIQLGDEEARHATQVLRLREGDPATVLDGAGQELRCAVSVISRRAVTLCVRERITHPAPRHRVTLLQAMAKGRTMEWIVEKATELGAAAIVPVLTERSVVRLDAADAAAKKLRWERTALEAVKQCGNPWRPRLAEPCTLEAALAHAAELDLHLVASLESGARPPGVHFGEFAAERGHPPRTVGLWVGPEGDFTADEYRALAQAGARATSLGKLVLRCETAAVAGLAVVLHELNATRPA